jgi:hypothetical protein
MEMSESFVSESFCAHSLSRCDLTELQDRIDIASVAPNGCIDSQSATVGYEDARIACFQAPLRSQAVGNWPDYDTASKL